MSNHRIQKFAVSGQFLFNWGTFGIGDGQLVGGTSITIDVSRDVFVVDGSPAMKSGPV